jgi:dipeptidyl aminopeptidase/acylaminoacyl peptidase
MKARFGQGWPTGLLATFLVAAVTPSTVGQSRGPFLNAAESEFWRTATPATDEGDLPPFALESSQPPQQGGANAGKVFRDRVDPHWFGDTNKFWYRVDLPGDKKEFFLVDAVKGSREPAFDEARLAAALSAKTGQKIEPGAWPFNAIEFSADAKSIRLLGADKTWTCRLESYEIADEPAETATKPPPEVPRRRRRGNGAPRPAGGGVSSPDGNREILVRGHNLALRDTKTDKVEALTWDANPDDSYARDLERDRSIEMQYNAQDPEQPSPEVSWAPDSRHFVAIRCRAGTKRRVYLVESSPKDQVQPKLLSYPYLKPGDAVPLRQPRLFDVYTKREIALDSALFPNPWSLDDIRWTADSSRFTFLYNQRGHQILRVVGVNANSGRAEAIVDERSKTFIDYAGKFFAEYLDDTGEIIWMSERDGWNHLYLYDAATGQVKNQITRGEWVVRGVERVDRKKRQIWFRAGGIRPGQDPYYIHYARVNFDGSGLVILTEADGTHSAQFSPDNRFFIDTWSRVDEPPVNELRRAEDGQRVVELEKADATALLASGWRPPEMFVAKGRDGVTDIYGVIWRPTDLDPAKKYPVIEDIYAGPHDSFAPKSFRSKYSQMDVADHGFVVVQMDGMGTSNRSKKFHDICWKNIGDAGFPDRVLWIKAAAAKYAYMDISRVGLYGGSAGGQNALRGLLAHGDFYKAASADCGCHDNRMDKIWWNELWMGWPVGPEYAEQSNVTQAGKLQGKLLLFVGELDHNVDPSSTMQVVNALIKADKDFDLIVVPGADHGAGGSAYGRRRMLDFFSRCFQKP